MLKLPHRSISFATRFEPVVSLEFKMMLRYQMKTVYLQGPDNAHDVTTEWIASYVVAFVEVRFQGAVGVQFIRLRCEVQKC